MRQPLATFAPHFAGAIILFSLFSSCASAQQTPPAPATTPPNITAYVNEVLVPVVVRDEKGSAIGDLKQQDFQIFEKGKPQEITGFTVLKRANAAAAANSTSSPQGAAGEAPPKPEASPGRYIALLFDDTHLTQEDLYQAQKATTKILASSLGDSDLAAVIAMSGSHTAFTCDLSTLQKAIQSLKPRGLWQNMDECPKVDYYQADRIVNVNDSAALAEATEAAKACTSNFANPELLARQAAREAVLLGDQDVRRTLGFLEKVVTDTGTLPGTRIVILISPGFMTTTSVGMALESRIIDVAARSNVTISTLDVLGLQSTMGDARQPGAQTAVLSKSESMLANTAVMAELAGGSGGTYFHNNNDLAAGLQLLTSAPEFVYLLAFSADKVKNDGKYHELKVKVDRPAVIVQSRKGYVAPPPKK